MQIKNRLRGHRKHGDNLPGSKHFGFLSQLQTPHRKHGMPGMNEGMVEHVGKCLQPPLRFFFCIKLRIHASDSIATWSRPERRTVYQCCFRQIGVNGMRVEGKDGED